jgi:polyhydroxybutyrate depolymerase
MPRQAFARTLAFVLALAAPPAFAESRDVDLGSRFYRADLPPAPTGAPILLVLHGGGGNPDQIARNSGMSVPANRAGYAVIYPAGTGRRLLTWNGGYCCGQAARLGIDDIAFLDAVIADAARRFGLDSSRIYITGMSNGSLMAEAYAASRPDAVKAVAGVAGTLDPAAFPVRGAVPLLHIHGTEDAQVPFEGGKGSDGYTDTDFTSVADVIVAFRRANGGGLSESTRVIDPEDDGMRTVETTWSRGRVPIVRLLAIEGGGHVWPGGRRASRQGGDTKDISANSEILRFFAAHP